MRVTPPIPPTWSHTLECPHCLASLDLELCDLTRIETAGSDVRTSEQFWKGYTNCGHCSKEVSFSLPDDAQTAYLKRFHDAYYRHKGSPRQNYDR